jgi:uncharacterized protein (DUF1501 family)
MKNYSRRAFLKSSFASSALITGASTFGLNLAFSQRLLAQSTQRFDDYKALVCVFLYGGADSYNLLIPTQDPEHQTYRSVRQNLAYSQEDLLLLQPQNYSGYELGMPSAAASLHELFNQQKLSVVANVGPMTQVVNKQAIINNPSLLPKQLFSHNDQQSLWQASGNNTAAASGWGGRMADLIHDSNDPLSMNLSVFGNNLMQAGGIVQPYALNATGPEIFEALDRNQEWNRARYDVFSRILAQTSHPLENAYKQKLISADQNNQRLIDTLNNVDQGDVDYPTNNPLAEQLRMVASIIAGQNILSQRRQIFFVGLGGWDTHDAQSELHPQLLRTLGEALQSFQNDLDSRLHGEQVTTFTMSEFGRTLTSNGDGTDHGWGGHQLVMGDAIRGGQIIGQLPSLALESNDDLGDGRMIPSLSVEQFGASLSKWFGLSDNELNAVFPNLYRFDNNLSLFT